MCGADPSLAAACCLCQLPLHHYKASSGSAGKQKIFTKFWCCFGGWGWLFFSSFTIAFNCLCYNIYHLPWTFPMCSVLVCAELRTLVPHTAHGSSYFGRLSLVLWRAAPSPPPLPPPPLAAPAPSRGTCRHHPQQLRQARWRSGWPGPGRGVVAIVTLPHPSPGRQPPDTAQNWFCSIVNNREILQSFSLEIFCIP